MVAPLVIGAGLAAGTLASSLLKKDGGPGYDVAGVRKGIQDSADKQNTIATDLTPKLAALNDPYKTNATGATTDAQAAARGRSDAFLKDIGESADKGGESLSNALLRRTMQGNQTASQQLREQLGSTGGLQNGASSAAFTDLAKTTANNLYEGNNNIIQDTLHARQDAMSKAYSVDQDLIKSKLGIDQDVLAKLYASGRQDLIDEANNLLGIEQTRSSQDQGAQVGYLNANLASASGKRTSDNALLASLLNAGGTYLGANKNQAADVRGTTATK